MSPFIVVAVVLLIVAVLTLIKAFVNLQVRDKRYGKGIKKKFKWSSLVYLIISVLSFYLSFRFYYYA